MMMNIANLLAEVTEATAVTAEAVASEGGTVAAGGAGELITTGVMMVAFIAIFYFMLIRPQRKKDKAVKDMLAALKVGDRICTIGGLYGTVAALKDDTVTLTMGSLQNTIVVARWAIRSVENVRTENDSEPQI